MLAFAGIGNIVNALAVVAGGLIGMALNRGVSQRMEDALMQAMGLCVIFIGITGALQNMFSVGADAAIHTEGTMMLIMSMVIGTFAGQLIDIESQVERFGDWLRRKVERTGAGGEGRFTEGFMTSTLIICVGAMAVVGGMTDGMGDPSTLYAKSVLDFVIVIIFASTMGLGVVFSALPLFIYQGVFVLIGLFAGNVLTDAMVSGISMVGSVIICGVGFNLLLRNILGERKLKVGNMLPSLLVPIAWVLLGL